VATHRKPSVALARLSLLLGSTAVAWLAAEGVYRRVRAREARHATDDGAWRERVRRMNRTIYRRSDDPALVYEPAPGRGVAMPYGVAGFNAAGMRDDREHDPAPDGRLRVAMVGDSIVWSEEVALEDSLPRGVERALGGRDRAEVLNFGVTGYDTVQEARWYERAVRPFRPRVVAVVYCLNDVMIMSGPYNRFATPEEAARKDAQDALLDRLAPVRAETIEDLADRAERDATFRLFARLRGWLFVRGYERRADYTDEYRLMYAQADRVARVRDALDALGAAIRADGAAAHLFISPVLRSWDRYHWYEIHARVAAMGRAAGFVVHDPLAVWQRRERAEALRLPGDALHYGARGNRVFGRYIADALSAR
jgi:lysophospholipase L1-like esterase